MAAENIAVTEHLVLRPMASGDAPALAAYRSDPVQAHYQSWETPYPVDSARALIAEMREVRFAQPGSWLQVALETAGRLIGDAVVRIDGDDPARGHGAVVHGARHPPDLRRLRRPQRPLSGTSRGASACAAKRTPEIRLVERRVDR